MPDRLIVSDVEASCRLGVSAEERATPQPIWMDLEVEIDAARAAAADDVADAVDYARLVDRARRLAQAGTFRLMETLAEAIAAALVREFPTGRVRVRVKKRALPGIGSAAVELTRQATERRPVRSRLKAVGSRQEQKEHDNPSPCLPGPPVVTAGGRTSLEPRAWSRERRAFC